MKNIPSIIKGYGFTWLNLPHDKVLPLQLLILEKKDFLPRIRPVTVSILNSTVFELFFNSKRGKIPHLNPPQVCPYIEGYDIISSKLLDIKILGVFPIHKKINTELLKHNSKYLVYTFGNSSIVKINSEILLEEYINSGSIVGNNSTFVKKLDSGSIYVITEIIQSSKFTIFTATDETIKGYLKVDSKDTNVHNLNISSSSGFDTKKNCLLKYDSENPITLALKAYRILKNSEGRYTLSKSKIMRVRATESLDFDTLKLDDINYWINLFE